jgi:hypothetical protein
VRKSSSTIFQFERAGGVSPETKETTKSSFHNEAFLSLR